MASLACELQKKKKKEICGFDRWKTFCIGHFNFFVITSKTAET